MPIILLFWLLSLVWAISGYGVAVFNGDLWSLIPFFGLGLTLWYVFRFVDLLISIERQSPGSIRKFGNVLGNLARLMLKMLAKDPEKYTEFMELLALPPTEFKARVGITIPD